MSTIHDTRPQLFLPGQHSVADGPLDITGMYVMHHAFRRDLDDFVAAAQRTPAGDRATWAALQERWATFSMILHHHHQVEDDVLWPAMLRYVDAAGDADGRATLEAMDVEHATIDPQLTAVEAAIATLAAGHATAAQAEDARCALEVRLVAARESLGRHLAHEEGDAMPLAQRHVSVAEWAAFEGEARGAYSLPQVAVLVPWVAKGLPKAALDSAFAGAGLPFKVLYWLTRGRFARRERIAFRYVTR